MLLKTTGGKGKSGHRLHVVNINVEQPSSGQTYIDDNKLNSSDTNNTKVKHCNTKTETHKQKTTTKE